MELPQETLGLLLIRAGHVTRSQLYEGLRRQQKTGERIGEALVALGLTDGHAVTEALAEQLGAPLIPTATAITLATAHRALAPPNFLNETGAIPLGEMDGCLLLAVADRKAIGLLEASNLLPDKKFGVYLVADDGFDRVRAAFEGDSGQAAPQESSPSPKLTYHEALEQLYEATDEAGLAEMAGLAANNFFNRIIVIDIKNGQGAISKLLGFDNLDPLELASSEAFENPVTWYGKGADGPDSGALSTQVGAQAAQKVLLWTCGALPEHGFAIYGDHGEGQDECYDDLQDLEGLFNEVKTALELLNNPVG